MEASAYLGLQAAILHVGSYPDYLGKEIKMFLTIVDHVLLRWPSG